MGEDRYELLLVDLTHSCTKMVQVSVPNWDYEAASDLPALTGDQYGKLCNSHAAADQKRVTLYGGCALHLTAHNRGTKFTNAYFNRWSQSRAPHRGASGRGPAPPRQQPPRPPPGC